MYDQVFKITHYRFHGEWFCEVCNWSNEWVGLRLAGFGPFNFWKLEIRTNTCVRMIGGSVFQLRNRFLSCIATNFVECTTSAIICYNLIHRVHQTIANMHRVPVSLSNHKPNCAQKRRSRRIVVCLFGRRDQLLLTLTVHILHVLCEEMYKRNLL